MTTYNIHNIADDEYVAIPVKDDDGSIGDPCGQVDIDTDGAWFPGSMADLDRSLADKALAKYLDQ